MSFIDYLDKNLTTIKRFESYEEFKEDPNYLHETFALHHFINREIDLQKAHLDIDNLQVWIAYIEQRAIETPNSVLKARYNDLLWTYKNEANKILKVGNVANKCNQAISCYIKIIEEKLLRRKSDEGIWNNLNDYLFRAWKLAKIIKNKLQQQILIDLMIRVEESIKDDGKIGLWGFSYKYLLKDSSIELTVEQEREIIDQIVKRVNRIEAQDYNALEYGVKKLLDYYKKEKEKQLEFFDILEDHATIEHKSPFENQFRFKNLIELYHKYQFYERKERAIIQYQKICEKDNEKLIKIEQEFTITTEQQKLLLDELFHENKEIYFCRITEYFITKKERIRNIHETNAKQLIFRSLFSTVLLNKEGIPIKSVIENTDDELYLENRTIHQLILPYLKISINSFQKKYKLFEEDWFELLGGEILYKGQEKLLRAAIHYYISGEYIAMIHIVIPLIENGLRNILFECDRSIYEQNKHDAFENITMTRILSELKEYLDEDVIFHLNYVLNEKAGLNLRNNLTHGLMDESQFHQWNALTLFHVLMILKYLAGFEWEA